MEFGIVLLGRMRLCANYHLLALGDCGAGQELASVTLTFATGTLTVQIMMTRNFVTLPSVQTTVFVLPAVLIAQRPI